MPLYTFKAVTATGEVREGSMEASSRAVVIERLRRDGAIPILAQTASARRGRAPHLWQSRRVTAKDTVLFTRQLAAMLSAGLPLERALSLLSRILRPAAAARLVEPVLTSVREGKALADAVSAQEGLFPNYYASMVKAGEASGSLDTALQRLTAFMEATQKLKDQVRAATTYPAVLLVLTVGTLVLMVTVVLPQFEPVFADAGTSLPAAARGLLATSQFMRDHGTSLFAGFAFAAFAASRSLRQPAIRLRWHRLLLETPLIGNLLLKIDIARLCRTLATLISSGVPLLTSLDLARGVLTNLALSHGILHAAARVREGKTLAEALATQPMMPELMIQLLRVSDETGALEPMLNKLSDIYDDEVTRTLQSAVSLFVPTITIALGAIIAGVIGVVFSAILSVYDLPF